MPAQELPRNPSLENLRKRAKSLRGSVNSEEVEAVALGREFHPDPEKALKTFSLSDAQLVLARSYSFPSWTKLKSFVEMLNQYSFMPESKIDDSEPVEDLFVRFACLDYL